VCSDLEPSTIADDRSLPTALFEIPNLTVLTLREFAPKIRCGAHTISGNNKLTSLPAAIGGLVNLKELNIGNNQIVSAQSNSA
jgi:hypothetical protein